MAAIGIVLRPIPSERVYALNASIKVQIDGTTLDIPFGFKTDGASIPRFAWITTGTPFAPEHIRAAVIHDWLYQSGTTNRSRADWYFWMLLRADGVSAYQAWKMYWALRLFGWLAWRNYRKRQGDNDAQTGTGTK